MVVAMWFFRTLFDGEAVWPERSRIRDLQQARDILVANLITRKKEAYIVKTCIMSHMASFKAITHLCHGTYR